MPDRPDAHNELTATPGDAEIQKLAAELNRTIYATARDLARRALGRPAPDTEAWAAELGSADSAEKRLATKHEFLTRLRLLRAARTDLDRAVLYARTHDLTWQEIGAACGMTRQAAYDRWGKVAKQLEAARIEARKPRNQEELDPVKWAAKLSLPESDSS